MTILGMQVDIAGLAALVNSLVLVPSVMALRKIAKAHEDRHESHDQRITALE